MAGMLSYACFACSCVCLFVDGCDDWWCQLCCCVVFALTMVMLSLIHISILLAAGAKGKRLMLPNARVLIHQPAIDQGFGKATEIEIQAKEMLRMREWLENTLAKHTGRDVEKIRKDIEVDTFLTAPAVSYTHLVEEHDFAARLCGIQIDGSGDGPIMVAIGIVDDLTHFPAVFAVLLGIVEDEQLAATGFRIRVDVFVFIVEVVERILPFVHAITPVLSLIHI